MKVKLPKKKLSNKFLKPISFVSDRCIFNIEDKQIYTLTHSDNNGDTVILYGKLDIPDKADKLIKLNIPDVKRLNRVIDCISGDDVELDVDSNSINYSSSSVRFKYHLLEDGIIQAPIINMKKIKQLNFDSQFVVKQEKILELLKASSIVPDSNKMYFYTKDKKVFAELTDKTLQNIDSVTFEISDAFTGTDVKNVIPISLEVVRLLVCAKFNELTVKINTKLKVLMFEISDNDLTLKYIVSALVK